MTFKSFYSRIIFVLATTSLILFFILAFVNTFLFRNEFLKLFGALEKPRINRLFLELDSKYQHRSPAQVKALLDSMYFEFNVELFDRAGEWITGVYSALPGVVVARQSRHLHDRDQFTTFTRIYYNPNPWSKFYAAKIILKVKGTPILRRMFFYFLLSSFFVILVSAIVGWRLVTYINRRLNRLKVGVSKVSQGEFDVHLADDGKDEIAFLARSFNYMSQQIQKLVHNLEESNAARQRLIAHASHEIKSPLTSIKGFIDIIEFMDILPDDQQKNLLTAVKKDLNRVIKITNDMLQLSQIRTPEYKLKYKVISLAKFLQEEHSYFAHKASINMAQAICDCRVSRNIQIKTDPEKLSQILDNLWTNALKYGDLTHPIKTDLFIENHKAGIKISNHLLNKLDIPPERLFEPFYRNPATSDKISGSGLGLAIVKELTDRLGGEIKIKVLDKKIEITTFFPFDTTSS